MTHSDQINELAAALAKAQGEIEGAGRDGLNPHFRSKYATLTAVWDAARLPLAKNGLSVLQGAEAVDALVSITTLLAHSSGQWVQDTLTLAARDATPQSIGSAITYGRRYGLSAMVGVAPEDDDGESAQPRNGAPKAETVLAAAATQAQRGVKAPDGYDAWLAALEGVAEEGKPAFTKAWDKSAAPLKNHLVTQDKDRWAALKRKAREAVGLSRA